MSDVSQHAPRCAGCAEISVPATDPVEILRRLPEALFSRKRPVPPQEATFDEIILDVTQFGPIGGVDPTPQYELARLFAQEKDAFRLGWLRAEANQLGLGLMSVGSDGETLCQCPRAAGRDLDRVGEQFGVGRPLGFTDCCYWRLVQLLLFKPATTVWIIRELAELYTGIRPAVLEEPAKLTLSWPVSGGASFADRRVAADPTSGWYADVDAFADGDVELAPADAHHAFALDAIDESVPLPGTLRINNFAVSGGEYTATGLTLEQAIERTKAAGIFVDYLNMPPAGRGGCFGATLRGAATGAFASPPLPV